MQQKNEKSLQLVKTFGKTIKKMRQGKEEKSSMNKFAFENDLDKGNLSRLENGLIEIKLTTLWKLANALEISPSKLLKSVEEELPKGFSFIDT